MKALLILLLVATTAWSAETTVLRDSKGHKVGSVKQEKETEKVYDSKGHYQGQYRSSDNTTRDAKGHKVGTGNQNQSNLKK